MEGGAGEAEAYLVYAHTLAQRIAAFCADTGIRTVAATMTHTAAQELVDCGCAERHFVQSSGLERHLRTVHGIKHSRHASHEFFYTNAPSVERIDATQPSNTTAELPSAAPSDSPAALSTDSASIDTVSTDPSTSQSLLEPMDAADASSPLLHQDNAAATTHERVVHAIRQAAPDAAAFYALVQRWRRIPRAFAVLAWPDDSSSSSMATARRTAIQGWLIAELSRTVFRTEALDMDLVEYVLGLVEHPEFCQPDLLVLELSEFLGADVTRFVLALWQFLVVDIATRDAFGTTKQQLTQQIRAQADAAAAEQQRSEHARLRNTERAQSSAKRTLAADAQQQQCDYKRRRPTYRKRSSGTTSARAVLRDVLATQMRALSVDSGRVLVGADHDDSGDDATTGDTRAQQLPRAAIEWTRFTDALRVRDMARREAAEVATAGAALTRDRSRERRRRDCSRSRSRSHERHSHSRTRHSRSRERHRDERRRQRRS